jgi:hypothetical protein
MSGPHRNPDKLNTIGVVVVGICGAVLVYVTITALQAFYVNDTSELQTAQDYGGQDAKLKAIRADQQRNINEYALATPTTYRIPVGIAMNKVIANAAVDPSELVPSFGKSNVPTICPEFGRPKDLKLCGAGSAAATMPPPTEMGSVGSAGSAAITSPASNPRGNAP